MAARDIRSYPLSDYDRSSAGELGVYVGRFEVLERQFQRPPKPHRHEHYELFWLRGSATHVNDFARYALPAKRPTFALVSPGQVHRWDGTDSIRGTLISFTSAFFDGREPPPSRLLDYDLVGATAQPVLPADKLFSTQAQAVIARCETEFAQRASGWAEALRAQLHELLIYAQRAYERKHPRPAEPSPAHLLWRRFRILLEAQFRTTSAPSAYAKALGVTTDHLNDVLGDLTGSTVGEMIRQRIVLEARRLLCHSDLRISEIAYQLGYKDTSYFARSFHRATEKSPRDFRAELRLGRAG